MTSSDRGEILTLEPLIEAIRAGVEGARWELSGLQKTTSHQFEGKWEGESTRSAYLFFHLPDGPDHVGVDIYLDETGRGLSGNLALVVDLVPFGELGDAVSLLSALGAVSDELISSEYRRPITLRLRIADAGDDPVQAETEVRFKVRIPRRAIADGPAAITALAAETMVAFGAILAAEELAGRTPDADEPPDSVDPLDSDGPAL